MKKILYIIPGWEDSCGDKQYQLLMNKATDKGYEVILHDVDWKILLSQQTFQTPPDSIIFGFSLGAILAYLNAQIYPCKHIILASMTPHYSFTDPDIKKALIDLAGVEFVEDIITHLKTNNLAEKQTIIYGDHEGERADILVRNTDHELTKNYIEEVMKLL